ncbi:MAG: hypothetical protein ABFS32_14445 [Bacteroidota bacterium]
MNIKNIAENLNKQLATLEKIKDDREKLLNSLESTVKYSNHIKKELERKNLTLNELKLIQNSIDTQKEVMDYISDRLYVENLIKKKKEEEIQSRKKYLSVFNIITFIVSIIALLYILYEFGIFSKILNLFVFSAYANNGVGSSSPINMPVVFYFVLGVVSLMGVVSFFYLIWGKDSKTKKFCNDILKVVMGFYGGIFANVVK